jgi:hypothetical protein
MFKTNVRSSVFALQPEGSNAPLFSFRSYLFVGGKYYSASA